MSGAEFISLYHVALGAAVVVCFALGFLGGYAQW